MKKSLMIAVVIAALGLSGCVVVPAYGPPYGYGYYHGYRHGYY